MRRVPRHEENGRASLRLMRRAEATPADRPSAVPISACADDDDDVKIGEDRGTSQMSGRSMRKRRHTEDCRANRTSSPDDDRRRSRKRPQRQPPPPPACADGPPPLNRHAKRSAASRVVAEAPGGPGGPSGSGAPSGGGDPAAAEEGRPQANGNGTRGGNGVDARARRPMERAMQGRERAAPRIERRPAAAVMQERHPSRTVVLMNSPITQFVMFGGSTLNGSHRGMVVDGNVLDLVDEEEGERSEGGAPPSPVAAREFRPRSGRRASQPLEIMDSSDDDEAEVTLVRPAEPGREGGGGDPRSLPTRAPGHGMNLRPSPAAGAGAGAAARPPSRPPAPVAAAARPGPGTGPGRGGPAGGPPPPGISGRTARSSHGRRGRRAASWAANQNFRNAAASSGHRNPMAPTEYRREGARIIQEAIEANSHYHTEYGRGARLMSEPNFPHMGISHIISTLNRGPGGGGGHFHHLGSLPLTLAGGFPSYETLMLLHERANERRNAASQRCISAMPVSVVSQGQDLGNCSICLEQMEAGQKVMRLLCLHVFHKDCIVPWLQRNRTCPIDKEDMEALLRRGDEDLTS